MTLSTGARLGPYEIESVLGAGGFGEVYKARDTRLGRLVAIKVLLPAIAADETFRERFEREARVISQLTHPHICTLYDVGHDPSTGSGRGPTEFLVMEYLEGETLDARLRPRAPADGTRRVSGALPLDESLRIALQIADALACAHGAGIMHRDLKPANVFLTKNGVKLLDFGLAKAAVVSGGPADVTTPVSPATMTAQGMIVGTLQYMAPEQVEGLETDSRVDIWAFGAILSEMVAGRPVFEARTPATLIAAVLKDQPPSIRQEQAPRALERVIAGCLEKDREQRWQSIRDVKRQLAAVATSDEAASAPAENVSAGSASAATVASVPARRAGSWVATIGGGILGVLGILAGYGIASRSARAPGDAAVVRFEIGPAQGTTIQHFSDTTNFTAPSPDGTRVAFVAGGTLWIKALDRAKPEEVSGAAGATSPFWSPDGRTIAFFAGGQLRKKVLEGGPPQTICAAQGTGNNGTWNADGVILFDEWGTSRIMRVAAEGGMPAQVRTSPIGVGYPQFLPDGRHFLYTTLLAEGVPRLDVGTLDGSDSTVVEGINSRAQFVDGWLLFRREGALVAQPFDDKTFRLTGSASSIADFVTGFASTGFAAFAAGGPRLLVYQAIAPSNRLVWVDRDGRQLETISPPRDYSSLRLSPDGEALAVTVRNPQLGTNDIWIHGFKRNIDTRLTNEKESENTPVWSPDGRTVVYPADRRGPPHVHARELSGSDEREITDPSAGLQTVTGVTPDGRFVVYTDSRPDTRTDVMLAPLAAKGPPIPLVQTKARDGGGRPSPDGKWLAYASDESGRLEVYVRPLLPGSPPSLGHGRWQISHAGGQNARWRSDSRELFYVEGGTRIMSVDVSTGVAFDVSSPRVVFDSAPFTDYDVAPDGRRFVLSLLDPEAETGTLSAILNWPSLLRR